MEAPKCSNCEKRHWSTQPCMANNVANKIIDMANEPIRKHVEEQGVLMGDSIPSSGSTYKYRDTEKRRAYQREYMRKRRANLRGL